MNSPAADNAPLLTKSQLAAELRALGVREGGVVMLHASVRELGWIVGGPRVVLDALLELLTPSGTLLMLASWAGNPYGMAARSEEERATWVAECPPFDPATSPADHREMSILAEYLRTWPGARRSDHPLASFVAVGALAAEFTAHHPWQYGHGTDSPLGRFCVADGMVLLLGPLLSNITLLHHAEQVVNIPEKRIDRYMMPVLRDGARVWVAIEEYDTTNGIADFGEDDYFAAIGRDFLATGRGNRGRVGATEAMLLPGAELVQFAVAWMEAHLRH